MSRKLATRSMAMIPSGNSTRIASRSSSPVSNSGSCLSLYSPLLSVRRADTHGIPSEILRASEREIALQRTARSESEKSAKVGQPDVVLRK